MNMNRRRLFSAEKLLIRIRIASLLFPALMLAAGAAQPADLPQKAASGVKPETGITKKPIALCTCPKTLNFSFILEKGLHADSRVATTRVHSVYSPLTGSTGGKCEYGYKVATPEQAVGEMIHTGRGATCGTGRFALAVKPGSCTALAADGLSVGGKLCKTATACTMTDSTFNVLAATPRSTQSTNGICNYQVKVKDLSTNGKASVALVAQ